MKTACPHCDSLLTLTEDQINQRQGMVRCGVCRQVFNAVEHLVEDDYPVLLEDDEPVLMPSRPSVAPSVIPKAKLASAVASSTVVTSTEQENESDFTLARSSRGALPAEPDFELNQAQVHGSSARPQHSFEAPPASSHGSAANPSVPHMSAAAPAAVHIHLNQHPQPRNSGHDDRQANHQLGSSARQQDSDDDYYIEQTVTRRGAKDAEFSIQSDSSYEDEYSDYVSRRSGGLLWFFLMILALTIFVAQFVYVFRNQISTLLPSARPMLIQMCGFLNCDLGFSKSIEDLELSQVNVGMDSSLKPKAGEQGLRLQANLLNKGTLATEWPSLVLTLKNETGSVSNRKVIEPRQYVLAEQLMQNFQPGAQISINLPFILSGDVVSNYELGLFFP